MKRRPFSQEAKGLSHFDGIIAINLAHRSDRKINLERELDRLSVAKQQRVFLDATFDELNGTKGCVQSHIRALEYAIEKKWASVLILEDDCIFSGDRNEIDAYIDRFIEHFGSNWDVLFLGTNIREFEKTHSSDFLRVFFSRRAHAYIVNGPYMQKLRSHYLETLTEIENDLFFTSSMAKALDRRWGLLQKVDRWYGAVKMFAHQMQSYSDIEKHEKELQ